MSRAIVIGGGMAGLLAARVLSRHFSQVTVIDPRNSPPSQAVHLHILLGRGQTLLHKLFPSLENEWKTQDCPELDWGRDTLWENSFGPYPSFESGIRTYSYGRVFLENKIREQVFSLPQVEFIEGHVEGLAGGRGVELREGKIIPGDFLVVAGGQNFPLSHFLGSYAPFLREERRPIHLTYRSVLFRQRDLVMKNFRQYYYQMDPSLDPLGAVLCPIERGMAVGTLIQYDPHPTKGHQPSYGQLADQVPKGRFKEIIKGALPQGPVQRFHKKFTHRRWVKSAGHWPANIIFMGDVLCSLNPVYGQGMTVCLEQAALLEKALAAGQFHSWTYHQAQQKALRWPYFLSGLEKGLARRALLIYLQKAQKSKILYRTFLTLLHSNGAFFS